METEFTKLFPDAVIHGEWDSEPDELAFEHLGYPCLIVRNTRMFEKLGFRKGHLCGYLGVPAGHPWHGENYDDVDVSIHGGLTYDGDHAPTKEPDGNWWVGFDCAHLGDIVPGMKDFGESTYKNMEFVTKELHSLAAQADKAK